VKLVASLGSALEAIAAGHPHRRLDEVLPWPSHPTSQVSGGSQAPLAIVLKGVSGLAQKACGNIPKDLVRAYDAPEAREMDVATCDQDIVG